MSTAYEPSPDKISLLVKAEPISLSLDKAIPCGLLLTELVSNCYKHAFPGDRCGTVIVSLERGVDGLVQLKVSDDGVGLKPDFELARVQSLGLIIVSTLAEQLGGKLQMLAESGTAVTLEFPDGLAGIPKKLSKEEQLDPKFNA